MRCPVTASYYTARRYGRMESRQTAAIMGVVFGVALFGFLGVCTRYYLDDCGLESMDVVLIRLTVASTVLAAILAILTRSSLKISLRDVPLFVLFGGFKFFSDYTYFYAQDTISLCLSTLLQMTAPFYVMFISVVLFKDRITLKKLVALTVGAIGCVMVTGVLTGNIDAGTAGILSALISGLFYGMFMIGSKISLDRGIKPETNLFYTLLFATLISLPFSNVGGVAEAVSDTEGMLMAVLLGVLLTLVPYFLLAWSVKYLAPTVSSMISTLEVVVAAAVGYAFFDENLGILNIAGMLLVIASIILMDLKLRRDYIKRFGKYIPPGIRNAVGHVREKF